MVADHPSVGKTLVHTLGCDNYSLPVHPPRREQQGLGCKNNSSFLLKPPLEAVGGREKTESAKVGS